MSFLYSQFFVTPPYPTKSFKGQTVIVTGSNTGLGKEAARHIARLGASKVILAVRNTTAGEAARKSIIESTKVAPSVVEVWELDLASYDSVKAFATRASKDLKRIDVLLENAGIAVTTFSKAEGHERTITVNVISTFLLAFLLLPKLQQTARDFKVQTHLTIVSSEVHGWTKFPEWKDSRGVFVALDDESSGTFKERYPTSKLLEVLTVRAIKDKINEKEVILNYLNPGLCHSELARDGGWALWFVKQLAARSTEVGSRTLVESACAGDESHGKYMSDSHVADEDLSPFVQSPDGDTASKMVWAELKDILEKISTGVTKGY